MTPRPRSRRSIRGLGLVELLIALAIAAFLLWGLFEIYYSNVLGSVAQQAETSLDDNIRTAVTLLTTDARQAGYRAILTEDPSQIFTQIPDNEADPTAFLATGSHPVMLGTWHGSPAPPYGFAVSFQSNGQMQNCLGETVPYGIVDTDEWKLDTSTEQLMCRSYVGASGTGNWANYTPLVNNVEMMVVRFGLDTENTDSVDVYADPEDVGQWNQVRSIQIGLIMASGDAANPDGTVGDVLAIPTSENFDLFGYVFSPWPTVPDRYLRVAVVRDIALRNIVSYYRHNPGGQ
jgi:type IV pilus assembly protein PilW